MGCSKCIRTSFKLHIESQIDSPKGARVVTSQPALRYVAVTVVIAADSGVNWFSGDCMMELLMRIHKYSTDNDKHTTLKCSSKIRFGEFNWMQEKLKKSCFGYSWSRYE